MTQTELQEGAAGPVAQLQGPPEVRTTPSLSQSAMKTDDSSDRKGSRRPPMFTAKPYR